MNLSDTSAKTGARQAATSVCGRDSKFSRIACTVKPAVLSPQFLLLLLLMLMATRQQGFAGCDGFGSTGGDCGSNGDVFQFTVNNGLVTITRVLGFAGKEVIIPTNGLPVVSIAPGAFNGSGLTMINIPSSVTNIGAGAFQGCGSLPAITVDPLNPNYASFNGALFDKNMTTLIQCPGGKTGIFTVPDTVTNIGAYAFTSCKSLTGVFIGNGVTQIGEAAFNACDGLTAITVSTLNPAYSSILGVFFNKDQTTLIRCPGGKTGAYAVPDSVTKIVDGAFSWCGGLSDLTIPNSVTSIGQSAFFLCSGLSSVWIGNGVREIGDYAFNYCEGLESLTVGSGAIGYSAFNGDYSLTHLELGNGVTKIGSRAFAGCYQLERLTIPSSVTSIGAGAFEECSLLEGVYMQGNAPHVGQDIFYRAGNGLTIYYLPGTLGWGATFGSQPTALWSLLNPMILKNGPNFGVRNNQFGFRISWATNNAVVVEACTNLAAPFWLSLATNTLSGGWSDFSDAGWTNYPSRIYRIRTQ